MRLSKIPRDSKESFLVRGPFWDLVVLFLRFSSLLYVPPSHCSRAIVLPLLSPTFQFLVNSEKSCRLETSPFFKSFLFFLFFFSSLVAKNFFGQPRFRAYFLDRSSPPFVPGITCWLLAAFVFTLAFFLSLPKFSP